MLTHLLTADMSVHSFLSAVSHWMQAPMQGFFTELREGHRSLRWGCENGAKIISCA